MQPIRAILALTPAFLIPGALGIAALFAQSPAQQSAQPPAQSPDIQTLKVSAHLTIVDITVSDKAGEAVHGLKQSDFTVLEDGKPQPLRSFGEYGPPAGRQVPPPLPPNVYSNLQASPTSSAVNIFLLDPMATAPGDSTDQKALSRSIRIQHDVKEGAMDYLKAMPAGTRVAVFSLTQNLRLLQGFTSDGALLAAAVNTESYDTLGRSSTPEMKLMQAESRNRSELEALRQVAVFASRIKGRKNLIWFTVGIPEVTQSCGAPPRGLPDYTRDLDNTYAVLAAAQVAIYPIDVHGAGAIIGCGRLSEEAVAEATGGVVFANTNDLREAIGKAIDHGSNFYTVSYVPPDPSFNGHHHTIDVKVDRPDLTVVFRKGYYSDDPAKYPVPAGINLPMAPPEVHNNDMKAAMSRSVPTSTEILFDVHIEPASAFPNAAPPKAAPSSPPAPAILGTLDPRLKNKPLVRYGFQYVLPAKQLAFKDGPKSTHHGSIDFDIAAYDADGKLLTGLSQTVDLPISSAVYQQFIAGPMRFFQQIDLPPGALFVRVGVLDRTSQKTGTLELPLTVAKR
jgi:VWFA-related protein